MRSLLDACNKVTRGTRGNIQYTEAREADHLLEKKSDKTFAKIHCVMLMSVNAAEKPSGIG